MTAAHPHTPFQCECPPGIGMHGNQIFLMLDYGSVKFCNLHLLALSCFTLHYFAISGIQNTCGGIKQIESEVSQIKFLFF